MCKQNPFDGFNVITMYTRAQAIADGVLHDVTDTAKKCGFRIPVAITDTIWSRWIAASPVQQEYGQSTEARLWDVLTVLYFRIRALPSNGCAPSTTTAMLGRLPATPAATPTTWTTWTPSAWCCP